MATIKLNAFVFGGGNETVVLINNGFNAVGDKWNNPMLVDFPVYFDGTFVVAPAIVSANDVQVIKDIIKDIEETDENDAGAVRKLRVRLSRLPKRIFVRQFFRESILDIVENGNVTQKPHTVRGAFGQALVDICDSEMTAADLQTAITTATDGKAIIAAADGYAKNSKGRNYQLIKYDLE